MSSIINSGNTLYIVFNYTINNIPIELFEDLTDIEFTYRNKQYYLSNGDISKDEETGKYYILIQQEDNFIKSCESTTAAYQTRFKIGDEVVSDDISYLYIGRSLSSEVI